MSRRHPALATREDAFAPVIDRVDEIVAPCGHLAEGFGVMGRPVIVTGQYRRGLGYAMAPLDGRLPGGTPVIGTAARAEAHVTSAHMVPCEMPGRAGGPEFTSITALGT